MKNPHSQMSDSSTPLELGMELFQTTEGDMDSDIVQNLQKPRIISDDDSVFKTCRSALSDSKSTSPHSLPNASVSRRLNWDRIYDPSNRPSRTELTDSASERSCRSDVRGFLSTIYGNKNPQSTVKPPNREDDLIQSNVQVTPTKSRRDGAAVWAASRHVALERLREELDARLRDNQNTFSPQLGHPERDDAHHAPPTENNMEEKIEIVKEVHDESIEKATGVVPIIELSDIHTVTERLYEHAHERGTVSLNQSQSAELAECTFHPCVSPNSSALFRRTLEERGEGDFNVFERLHQIKRVGANNSIESETMDLRNELEERRAMARAELEALRERCGALTAVRAGGDTFELFLHNAIGAGDGAPPYVQTEYRSKVAQEEGIALAKKAAGRHYRIANFDEFLNRQNAHFVNRSRTIRALEQSMTPSFKPSITETSEVIAREMRARTDTTNDSVNASSLASAVKKHRSPYVDPCTFKPKITPVSSALPSRGVESMVMDAENWRKSRQLAQEKAKEEELRHPFRPTVNKSENERVQSYLNPKNYDNYRNYLRRRGEQRETMKLEKEAREANEGVAKCTFKPKTTRPPTYVARMASSFALVRKQYGDI